MKQPIINDLVGFVAFVTAFVIAYFFAFNITRGDEGMWLFENAPERQIREKYDFRIPDYWLSDLQFSSCRFGRRGSASFVSSKGLILTNHHVGARDLHELSTPENNLLEKGFYAKTLGEERKCPGLEVLVLKKIVDVTAEIVNLTTDEDGQPADSEDAAKIRNRFIAQLEQEAARKSGLRCEVVTLYQGGAYHLYGYKVYNDIRLVWAPEESIASFGGDPDNYEYPRFCLDACLFRAYENDQPAEMTHFLRWCRDGLKDGELVFVSGFPGSTNRAFTKEHLEFMRDVYFPLRLQKLFRREVIFSAYGNRSLENRRKIANDLGVVQNYRKRAMGQLAGLQTPSLWDGKSSAEEAGDDSPEARIAAACVHAREYFFFHDMLEQGDFMKTSGDAFHCRTFQIAKTLVRLALETAKPDNERLKEYRDGSLAALKTALFVETPIHEDVEILKLTDSLTMLREYDSGELWEGLVDEEFLPEGRSPGEIAREWIFGSKVRDVSERKRIAEGGVKAIDESNDPMIRLAFKLDEIGRELRQDYDKDVETPLRDAYAELAGRRFEELGTSVYPDATFTLRLSYGVVQGYKEDDGTEVAPFTDIAGMFKRGEALRHKEPFDPPRRWKDAKDKLDLTTPFNFVTTNDIIGGNSGSPVVNTKGEIVGLAFDGNVYSLSNNFVYSETQSRCVSVHVDVILEALKKIDAADRILEELGQ